MTNELEVAVSQLVTVILDFTYRLTRSHAIDPESYQDVVEALGSFAEHCAGLDSIPRVAANVLVDLVPLVWGEAVDLEGTSRVAMIDAAIDLGDRVRAIVAL
jgi:2-iminoacetate synthase ThiH